MWIGQGIAFAALVFGTVYLEVHGKPVTGLWVLIVLWVIGTDWHPKTPKSSHKLTDSDQD